MKTLQTQKLAIPLAVSMALGSAVAGAENPYLEPDGSWISINGTVVSPEIEEFVLDYGSGMVTVEMDDWDAYGKAYKLMDGDRVTVYGRVDDDFWETTSIEAASVFVENLNTYFYSNSVDEEAGFDFDNYWAVTGAPLVLSETTLRGTVKNVDEKEKRFELDIGNTDIVVETDELGYNPLDDLGFQQVDKGDIVTVTGSIDHEFIDGKVFNASRVTSLVDSGPKS